MTFKPSTLSSVAAIAAAVSMASAPAAAAELPYLNAAAPDYVEVETGDAGEANQHRRWRRHRHRDRVDAGDVVAGVLVIGAIAALAGAFSGDGDDDRRDRDYRDDDYRDDYRADRYESSGVERAADMCVDQVERGDDRVEDVTQADRRADGWHVAGTLRDGESWTCWIDNNGRLRSVDFGAAGYSGAAYPAASGGEQWTDDAYARARANTRTPADEGYSYRTAEADVPTPTGPQPAYPGGPLPGEEGYGEAIDYSDIDGDLD